MTSRRPRPNRGPVATRCPAKRSASRRIGRSGGCRPEADRPLPDRAHRSADRLLHIAVLVDLDVVSLGRAEDLLPGALLRRLALEVGLVEAGDRVADV